MADCSTPNQDNPLMDLAEVKGTPALGIDVWGKVASRLKA
jgi:Fe-Mn family superoxide dismutase